MDCLWTAASAVGELGEKEVHVWCANLEPERQQLAALEETLTAAESERAEGFRFWRHRRRYTAGRGILRELLGGYLKMPPADIRFSYSEFGKPFLNDYKIQFNVSHSKGIALFAFCLATGIGIDVEMIRPISDAEGIAKRFFSPGEYSRFQALPEEVKDEAFFTCWTRKEAFIKAGGEGLSYPLDNFDVSFSPGEKARVMTIGGSSEEADRWSLYSLPAVEGYASALAILGQDWQLSCHHYMIAI